jgi:cytochrome c biogenesis protein CcmG, thiol:disulfide interchange protein DsbE
VQSWFKSKSSHDNTKVRLARILQSFLLILTASFLVAGCDIQREGLGPGENAPQFSLQSLDGQSVSLSSFRGSYVLLNFWAAWCAPCVEEMPLLEKLASTLNELPFRVVTIAEDEAVPQLAEFRKRFNLTIPILLDTSGAISKKYKVTGYPETFLIDPSGRIVMIQDPSDGRPTVRLVGPRDWVSSSAAGQFAKLAKNQTEARGVAN